MSDEAVKADEATLFAECKAAIKEELKPEIVDEVRADLRKEFARKGSYTVPAVAKEDDGSFGELVQAVCHTIRPETREKAYNLLTNKYEWSSKAMSQGTNTAGGFLVPPKYNDNILAIEDDENILFNRVQRVQMASNKEYWPVRDQTVTPSNGSSAYNAGVAVAVVSEGNAPGAETKPAFKQLLLDSKKVLAYTDLTNELIDNNTAGVQQVVQDITRRTILDYVDNQGFNGSDLTGMIGHASTIAVPRNEAGEFKLVDSAKMYSRLVPAAKKRAFWVVHPYHLENLIMLQDASGRLVWKPDAQGGLQMYLHGLPVYTSQFLPGIGSEGDVLLVDPQGYMLGINKDITLAASTDFKFTSDITTIRATCRLDFKPILTSEIILADGSSLVSTCVVLDNATS